MIDIFSLVPFLLLDLVRSKGIESKWFTRPDSHWGDEAGFYRAWRVKVSFARLTALKLLALRALPLFRW